MKSQSSKQRPFYVLAVLYGSPLLVLTAVGMTLWMVSIPESPESLQSPELEKVLSMDFSGSARPLRTKIQLLQSRILAEPQDSKAIAALGIVLMAHELKSAAIPCFELLAFRENEDFRWPYLLGHCRMFIEPDRAVDDFAAAVRLNPVYLPARMMLVEVLLANGSLDIAEQSLTKEIPDHMRQHPWYQWQASRLACLQGNFAEAEVLLEQLVARKVVSRSLLRQLILVKRRTSGDTNLQKLNDELSACPQELLVWECPVMRAVQIERLDFQSVMSNAQTHLSKGELQKAIGVYRNAIAENPESAELIIQFAELWLYLDEAERADGALTAAAELEQGSLRVLLLQCQVDIRLKQWEAAAEHGREALLLKPDSAEAVSLLAVIAYEQGDQPEAEELVQEALRLDPLHPRAKKLAGQFAKP